MLYLLIGAQEVTFILLALAMLLHFFLRPYVSDMSNNRQAAFLTITCITAGFQIMHAVQATGPGPCAMLDLSRQSATA